MLPVIEQSGASICLDVGHLAYLKQYPLAFFTRHQARIRHVHLHDAGWFHGGGTAVCRDHLPLGEGEMDYVAFMAELSRSDFAGAIIVENNSIPDLTASLQSLRGVHMAGFPLEPTPSGSKPLG